MTRDSKQPRSSDPSLNWIVEMLELLIGGVFWLAGQFCLLVGRLLYCLWTGKAYSNYREQSSGTTAPTTQETQDGRLTNRDQFPGKERIDPDQKVSTPAIRR